MGMICRLRRSSNANEVRNFTIAFGAQAFDDNEVLRAFEGAVFVAMIENALRHALPHVRQACQFSGGSGVEVDARLRPARRKQKAKGK